ncbi:MAG TPA: PDDEXK nuclease domain-containing protein [Bacilli bacterium]|nr:PDDEXK nuclease domain-containing protein [Bacilli bacterium]
MNYYNEIKQELINNEINKKVKDYSKNKSDLNTYYNVGKLLSEAGKHYGEGIVKDYSIRLTSDLGINYSVTSLKYIRQFYLFSKSHSLSDQLSFTHYKKLLSISNSNKINYYINISIKQNLSVRQLETKIKNEEYERLDDKNRDKLINKKEIKINDFIKNPILIKNSNNYTEISEKLLKKLILEDIDNFLTELGDGFCYIKNEYKIKLGDRYNYIDLLLYNIKYKCYVVLELKVSELKSEHIGQITKYMSYIDKNIKSLEEDKTIGIIIVKKDNAFVMEYCSDDRIFRATYIIN